MTALKCPFDMAAKYTVSQKTTQARGYKRDTLSRSDRAFAMLSPHANYVCSTPHTTGAQRQGEGAHERCGEGAPFTYV